MYDGKRGIAAKIVYDAIEIKLKQKLKMNQLIFLMKQLIISNQL